MPNPYYIPRRTDTSRDLMGLAGLGLQLYGLKQHGEIAAGQQKLTEKELGLRGETLAEQKRIHGIEYGTPGNLETGVEPTIGLKEQQLNQEGRKIDIAQQQTNLAGQKLNPREKNWGLGDYTMFSSRLRQMGFEPDKLEFMKELKATAMDNNINRGAFAENLKVSWDQGGKNRFLENLQQNVEDTLKKNPNADVRKQLALIDILQTVESQPGQKDSVTGKIKPDVISTFFPDIAQHDAALAAEHQKPLTPQSDIGKLQEDRKRYLSEGYKEDSTLIKAIDSEIKKKSEITPPKVQSMGNAVDLAINRKFKDPTYLTDANKQMEALAWLGTPEGKKAVQEAALDVTPPTITVIPTSEGLTPIRTRGPGAGTVGQPIGGKPISTEQASKIGDLNTLLSNLETIKGLYKPEWVGPVAGRVGSLQEKYTGGASEEQVKFYAYVRDIKDALLRARSGAQINEQEYARLVKFLPDETSPAKTFEARVERFKESLQTILSSKKQALGEAGYGIKTEKSKKIGRFTVEVE